MKVTIYALYDPITPKVIRYIGKSKTLTNRIRAHQAARDKTTKPWVKQLLIEDRLPSYRVLEVCDGNTADSAEEKWINKFSSEQLLNKVKWTLVNAKPFTFDTGLTLFEMNRRYILTVIDRCRGNKLAACRVLGIGRQTLYNKLASFNKTD